MNESKVLRSPYRQFYARKSPLKSSTIKNDLNFNSTACNCTSTATPPSECRGPNSCTEVKGSKSVSCDTSRNIKPSGLRMLSPELRFFDVEDSLVPIENGGGKSHSGVQNAVSKVGFCSRNLNMYANRSRPGKIQSTQTMKNIKPTKIFHQQTKGSITSRTKKSISSLAPVSIAQSEPHCVDKSKDYLENEKENIIDFENNLEYLHEQVRTLGVSGDVVIEFDAKNGSSED
ncbi:hypothetical protein Lalb_Chr19g0129491 [Lupinus albus]|uniref:Uncharacterized protein n=1 Tax=Lupinus albus TaxID=3870 RepID=A0A6A4P0H5_LUPAL|nr:hypothetical protein Lalb_Chr19g0129491 [Lupinus albus]